MTNQSELRERLGPTVQECASDILKMVMEMVADPEGGIAIDQVEGLILGHLLPIIESEPDAAEAERRGYEMAHELRACGHSVGDHRDPEYIPEYLGGDPNQYDHNRVTCVGCDSRDAALAVRTEAACAAMCSKCAAGMPVHFKTCFDKPDWYHVFTSKEEWWKQFFSTEWWVRDGHQLHDKCGAAAIRSLSTPSEQAALAQRDKEKWQEGWTQGCSDASEACGVELLQPPSASILSDEQRKSFQEARAQHDQQVRQATLREAAELMRCQCKPDCKEPHPYNSYETILALLDNPSPEEQP